MERVKKIRDYAFVHFTNREACMNAMDSLNATRIDGTEIEVTLAKPVDKSDYNRLAKVGAKVLTQSGVEGQPAAAPTLVRTHIKRFLVFIHDFTMVSGAVILLSAELSSSVGETGGMASNNKSFILIVFKHLLCNSSLHFSRPNMG